MSKCEILEAYVRYQRTNQTSWKISRLPNLELALCSSPASEVSGSCFARKTCGDLRRLWPRSKSFRYWLANPDRSCWALCTLFGHSSPHWTEDHHRTERRQLTNELAPARDHDHDAAQTRRARCARRTIPRSC